MHGRCQKLLISSLHNILYWIMLMYYVVTWYAHSRCNTLCYYLITHYWLLSNHWADFRQLTCRFSLLIRWTPAKFEKKTVWYPSFLLNYGVFLLLPFSKICFSWEFPHGSIFLVCSILVSMAHSFDLNESSALNTCLTSLTPLYSICLDIGSFSYI